MFHLEYELVAYIGLWRKSFKMANTNANSRDLDQRATCSSQKDYPAP